MATSNSLTESTNRVDAPVVRVRFGEDASAVAIGVYDAAKNSRGAVFPNFIQTLEVQKINGTVNTYTLVIDYPITQDSDLNFFEKLLGSISKSRIITFDYGDATTPNFFYTNERAFIIDVKTTVDINNSKLTYTIKAQGTATVSMSTAHSWDPLEDVQPSVKIQELLEADATYHLKDIFYGFDGKRSDYIDHTDKRVTVPAFTGMSVLDYINKLVSYMETNDGKVFTLTTYDSADGPYFTVKKVDADKVGDSLTTYTLDIGYPTANIVTSFQLNDDNNWALNYNYSNEVAVADTLTRIDNRGVLYEQPNSVIQVGGSQNVTLAEKTWWKKVTAFPITATIQIKGLLKPAMLMQYLRINVWLAGQKHASSGYYIITSQVDHIGVDGYYTTIGATRIAEDQEFIQRTGTAYSSK